ncbi:palmitoyltransferase [Trichonephila inaurata madagascariensis]|uniref:Palmitoyltransferase n=1 Tax=Trichonephila inaurata madagascariensis TaxID=2747483 RepID=A0A8X7C796_9ARAC|nr:palmitoyltransferase [Trichonephila inaurata madagascariensis]
MEPNQEFSLPFNKNNLLPKNNLDRGLFILMTFGIPSITLWELRILLGYHTEQTSAIYITHKLEILPFLSKKFTSKILSLPNLRFFYIMIGSLYASVLQWPHIIESIGGFHWMSLMCMIAPHIAVLGGFLSIYGFICAVSQIVLASVFVLTTFLLFVQMKCIFNGQTIHEKKAEITLYDLGWKKNFIQVLGKNWYLAILSPLASSPVDGDGVNFMTFYDLSEIKNV